MANNFSGDSSCKALWRFESGALTTDSIGGNTLGNALIVADTDAGDYKEGSASAYSAGSTSGYQLYIADADLDAGFPLKNGVTTKKVTVTFWTKLENKDAASWQGFFTKNLAGTRSLAIMLNSSSDEPVIAIGYDGGASATQIAWPTAVSNDVWYFVAVTVQQNGANIDYTFQVWDDTAGTNLGGDATISSSIASETWNIEDSSLFLLNNSNSIGLTGWMDEVVVFDRVLSQEEIDEIRAGTYVVVAAAPQIIRVGPF